jgi:DNA-binding GntR family transcriptional regulator
MVSGMWPGHGGRYGVLQMAYVRGGGSERLADKVAELLRERIVEGRYRAGERLPRGVLADELSVSPAVVGEALRMLHREGFVAVSPGGAMVRPDERSVLQAAYEFREALDGLAARLAAERAGGGLEAALRGAIEAQRAATESLDHRRAIAANVAFHCAIIDATANPFLISQRAVVRWTSRGLGRRTATELGGINDEHERILVAISTGDPDEAERMARAHVHAITTLLNAEADAPPPAGNGRAT